MVSHMAGKPSGYRNRFVAELLFQFREVAKGRSFKRRMCLFDMFLISAVSNKQALVKAKRRGKGSEYEYKNARGNKVCFEFVGVVDLLHLGMECDPDEVWHEARELMMPMERKKTFIPTDEELLSSTRSKNY